MIPQTFRCDRARFADNDGDISASYSTDLIAIGGQIRKPFPWLGFLWVSIGGGANEQTAYRLVPYALFAGDVISHSTIKRDDPKVSCITRNGSRRLSCSRNELTGSKLPWPVRSYRSRC
jgi:hypothetical protein